MNNLMSLDDGLIAAEEMEKTGGSFVKALGKAYFRADSSNARKLINSFPEYFEAYFERADERD